MTDYDSSLESSALFERIHPNLLPDRRELQARKIAALRAKATLPLDPLEGWAADDNHPGKRGVGR